VLSGVSGTTAKLRHKSNSRTGEAIQDLGQSTFLHQGCRLIRVKPSALALALRWPALYLEQKTCTSKMITFLASRFS